MKGISFSLEELINLRNSAQSLSLSCRHRVKNSLISHRLATLRGRGIDFDEVRIYQPGDDIRNMEWRVTARSGKPHIKLYHEERERPVFLVVDLSPTMFFGTKVAFKSAIATQAAALLGWAAVHNGDKLGGIVIFSEEEQLEFPPLSRQHGILPFLKVLANQNQAHAQSSKSDALSKALAHLRHIAKPSSLIFIISDFQSIDNEIEKNLSSLKKHTEIISIAIHDPLEVSPPPPGLYAISDGQSFSTMNTGGTSWRTAYQKQFEVSRQQLMSMLRRNQIPLIKLSTTDPVYQTLYQTLREA